MRAERELCAEKKKKIQFQTLYFFHFFDATKIRQPEMLSTQTFIDQNIRQPSTLVLALLSLT
jgi:hypothetical protein